MNAKMFLWSIICVIMVVFANPSEVSADGIIIPEPPICFPDDCLPPPCPGPWPCPPMPPTVQLAIRYHRVSVEIDTQVATTRVDQIFYNPNDYPVEGTYVFPLPEDAAVNSFRLWVDGQAVDGEIMEASEARETYEEIVRTLRDPALLEYVDREAVKARIFPISPGGESRIQLEYTQGIRADNGLVQYIYPLSTEKYSLWPLDEVTIHVHVRSSQPIRAVYSPSHDVAVSRESDQIVQVGYERNDVRPDKDFVLIYSVGEQEAFHLITNRNPNDPQDTDGYFLMLLAPKPIPITEVEMPKDVLLVLDRSGSMEGEKFQQAQDAIHYILNHLNQDDHFNIIAFSTGIEIFGSGLQPVEAVKRAHQWVDKLSAMGSTDINRALLEAMTNLDSERTTYLIFLTDGLPTEGVVDSPQILKNINKSAQSNLRLFSFGVGYDVDTYLLDSISSSHHGASYYVLPGESLDEAISTFYEKIRTPVLTDLEIDYGNLSVYDVYPDPLPDLFAGSQIIVVGRYKNHGSNDITVTGKWNDTTQVFKFPEQTFTNDGQNAGLAEQAISRLWATRKIGYLLNQIRMNGPNSEIIEQIVKLSIRHGIVTPYTSYLVTEPMVLGSNEQDRIAEEQYYMMEQAPAISVSGQVAVERAMGQGAMADASIPAEVKQEDQSQIRLVGDKTFIYNNGIWIDTGFDPDTMITTKVAFLSDNYFKLIDQWGKMGAFFALGQKVIVLWGSEIYEVVDQNAVVEPLDISDEMIKSDVENESNRANEDVKPFQPRDDHTEKQNWIPCLGGLFPLLSISCFAFSWRGKS
jgi:Ca-activated chloride channel family protein